MSYRRNAKKSKRPAYFPKKRDLVAGCDHVDAELHADFDLSRYGQIADTDLFENQFSNLTVYEPNDDIYRYYYICPQCLPESFEDFYLNVYPALSDVTPENKQQRQKLSTYLSEKNIKAVSLPSLLRTHALGSEPSIGDHVHICEHMDKWLVPIIIQVDDGFTEIEAYGDEGENVEQPDFLIFCPTCIAEWDPEEIYEVVEEKTWNKRIQRWLKKTYPIFRTATEFFEWLFEKLEEEAEDIEDYEYNGPVLGEPVLLCDHLDPEMLIEEAEIEPIFSDRSQFTLPGSDVSPLWIAACTECTSQTDTPYQVAQSKTKNKQLHHWTH